VLKWPAVIKYAGEDELVYVCNEQEWLSDPDLCSYPYIAGDAIIDSNGQQYSLPYSEEKKRVEIFNKSSVVIISDFEILIKNHMVSLNQCCSSKIRLTDFADGITLVERTVE